MMKYKSLSLIAALAVGACSGNGGNSEGFPELNSDNASIPSQVSPCDSLVVQMTVPAYSGDLTAGVDLNDNTVCEEIFTPQDSRTFECTYETCNSDGEQTIPDGTIDVCAWISAGNDLSEYCQNIIIDGSGSDSDTDTDSDSDADVSIVCAQDSIYLNRVNCSASDAEGSSCVWSMNGADESGGCSTYSFDNFPSGADVVYGIVADNGSDEVTVSADYEMPSVGNCTYSGGPTGYVSAACARDPPENPDGKETLFDVVNTNLPDSAGPWLIQQSTGLHTTSAATPADLDMDSLFIDTRLCVDYNGNGEVDSEETNCGYKTIDDF